MTPVDVAPQLEAAAIAIEERRWEDAIAQLLAAWLDCRIARIKPDTPDTPNVREALVRIVRAWPKLQSAQILGLDASGTN